MSSDSAASSQIAIIVANNPGGAGKTTIVGLAEAVATFANKKLSIVDADASNHGFSIETNDPRTTKLVTLLSASEAAIPQFVYSLRAAGTEVVLVDGGAALTASDARITNGFRDLCESLKGEGYQIISVLPVPTSKGQSETPLSALANRLLRLGKVALAKTDALGSGYWPEWIRSADFPVINVPRLLPGFVDLRKRFAMPLSAFLMIEDGELCVCQAAYADACFDLISDPFFSVVANGWDHLKLLQLTNMQRPNYIAPSTAADAISSVMQAKACYLDEFGALRKVARFDADHPAHRLFRMQEQWLDARKAAQKIYPRGLAGHSRSD